MLSKLRDRLRDGKKGRLAKSLPTSSPAAGSPALANFSGVFNQVGGNQYNITSGEDKLRSSETLSYHNLQDRFLTF